jgi:hypothetical protein
MVMRWWTVYAILFEMKHKRLHGLECAIGRLDAGAVKQFVYYSGHSSERPLSCLDCARLFTNVYGRHFGFGDESNSIIQTQNLRAGQ